MNSKIESHIISVLDNMQENFVFGPSYWIIRYIINDSILRINFQDEKIEIEVRKMNEDLVARFNPVGDVLIEKLKLFKSEILNKKQAEQAEIMLQRMTVQDDSFLATFDLVADFESYILTLIESKPDQLILESSNHLLFDHSINNTSHRFRLSETRMRDLAVGGKVIAYDLELRNLHLKNAITKHILFLKQERSTKIRDVFADILKHNDKNKT